MTVTRQQTIRIRTVVVQCASCALAAVGFKRKARCWRHFGLSWRDDENARKKPNPSQMEKTKIVTRKILRENHLSTKRACTHFTGRLYNRVSYVHLTFGHFRVRHKDNEVNNIIALTILLRHCTCLSVAPIRHYPSYTFGGSRLNVKLISRTN